MPALRAPEPRASGRDWDAALRQLIGFRPFGSDGQVPGDTYDDSGPVQRRRPAPRLTGKGLGRQAIRTGLASGRAQFCPPAFRVTVAAFNLRALRVIQDLGFSQAGRFEATTNGRRYVVLTRAESE